MNDPSSALFYILEMDKSFEGKTTVLPDDWEFNKTGNTRLKRKRKNANNITLESKQQDWLNFTCQVWSKKLNRENKARLMKKMKTINKKDIEQEIRNYEILKK